MAAVAVDVLALAGEPRRVSVAAVEPPADDRGLVEAARGGDPEAFDELYRRYARMVHGILLARVSRPDVDDLVQEVFLSVFRKIRSLRDAGAFGGWLAMIARNRATDHHRHAPKDEALPPDLEATPDPPRTAAQEVLDLIRSLPEAYREPLMLRLVEGMTGPEISQRTGLTPGSVRVNLHRGMQQLREKLAGRQIHG